MSDEKTPQLYAVSTDEILVDDTFIENKHADGARSLQGEEEERKPSTKTVRLEVEPELEPSPRYMSPKKRLSKKSDPFAAFDEITSVKETAWKDLSPKQKMQRFVVTVGKLICLLVLLYLFICSLGFLGDAFKLIGGKTAGKVFSSNKVLSNPVAGLMIGVLATVLLQSSSTTSSIVVAMVASGILEVRPGVPIIMGANIGTSVTNTLVALTQIGNKDEFRRAFAGATVHDMFNMLCVIIFLPLEVITGYLFHLSNITVESMDLKKGDKSYNKEFLKVLTKPFTDLFVQLDNEAIVKLSEENNTVTTIIKYWCDDEANLMTSSNNYSVDNYAINGSVPCQFLFNDTGLNDSSIGIIMLIVALFLLCTCLVLIVKILNSMLKGHVAKVIKKTINSDFPHPFGFLTGYFAILVGAVMTFLVQSSSIFTSAMTPLVGVGVVSLERIYPLTLGSNIGTTATSILAALASSSDKLAYALQISLCHLFFNISGILLFFPIARFRQAPINGAKYLGNQTAKYRWYAVVYMILGFFVIPACFFGLSLSGRKAFICVFVTLVVLLLLIFVINVLQRNRGHLLPEWMRTWNWLPIGCRSLKPYDRLFSKCVTPCRNAKSDNKQKQDIVMTSQSGY